MESQISGPAGPAHGPQHEHQQQQHHHQQDPSPRFGWDLTLHPKALDEAYWRERAPKYSHWDYQVGVACQLNDGRLGVAPTAAVATLVLPPSSIAEHELTALHAERRRKCKFLDGITCSAPWFA